VEWKKSKNFPQLHSLAVSPLFPPNSGRPQRKRDDEKLAWPHAQKHFFFIRPVRGRRGALGGHASKTISACLDLLFADHLRDAVSFSFLALRPKPGMMGRRENGGVEQRPG
jgi:hypothetical protein